MQVIEGNFGKKVSGDMWDLQDSLIELIKSERFEPLTIGEVIGVIEIVKAAFIEGMVPREDIDAE